MNTEFQWTDKLVSDAIVEWSRIIGVTLEEFITQFKVANQPKGDWEIISHRIKHSGEIVPVGTTISGEPICEIYSVRRLSDGEVFTIGDKIEFMSSNDILPIEKFNINPLDKSKILAWHSFKGIESIIWEKQKKPLFTTQDGVKIYDGDTKPLCIVYEDFSLNNDWLLKDVLESPFEKKVFSTKEKAEEYIQWNKPLFSLSEIKANSLYVDEESPYLLRLIEIAKNKLNNNV